MAIQADGKILVGGDFTTLGGESYDRIARLTVDGEADSSFNPGVNGGVYVFALQENGSLLAGGGFTSLGGLSRYCIGRIHPSGSPDTLFNPAANNLVDALAVQPDGKILFGGAFTNVDSQPYYRIARVEADGELDDSFNPGADDWVLALAVQPDGKILVGGGFTILAGQPRGMIARLNADGTLDEAFNPGANGAVRALVPQADGKILVGGDFTTLGGQRRNQIGRLNPDGTLDNTFNPGANGSVDSILVQTDGKILVGGWFTSLGRQPRNYLARLNPNGTVDGTFDPGADEKVSTFAIQADGKIVVVGNFTELGGQPRNGIGRLHNTGPATETLDYDDTTITWARAGTGPEVWWTSFDYSTDGVSWINLGPGTRVPGGWQCQAVDLPTGALIRARGFAGDSNHSGWFVESQLTNTPASDLVAAELNAPSQLAPGAPATISWTILNRGRSSATNEWLDRLYLSPDINPANGWLVAEFPTPGPLARNETLIRVQNIAPPPDLATDTDYWWILVTDATDSLVEQDETNNTRVSEAPLRLVIPPIDPPAVELELNLDPGNVGASVRVVTVEGLIYTLEYKDHLEDSEWKTLQQVIGDGGEQILEDAGLLQERRYYRVRVH